MDTINAVNQILETTEIMTTSKNIDTIEGRADFLRERLPTIQQASKYGRYRMEVQRGLDRYKEMYYDRDVHEWQVKILTYPDDFDVDLFCAKCLWKGFGKYYESQLEEIDNLKMAHAIEKRYKNLADKLDEVKTILNKLNGSTETAQYVNSIQTDIEELENEIQFNIDHEGI